MKVHVFTSSLTFFGTIDLGFITEISTVIVPITGPMAWDTPATGTSELILIARVNTAHLVTAVPTVVIWEETSTTGNEN